MKPILFLWTIAAIEAFVIVPTGRTPATTTTLMATSPSSASEKIAEYWSTLVSSAKKWKDESSRTREEASRNYRDVLEASSEKWSNEKAQIFEEAHTRYHATLESAVNKWAKAKESAVNRYRATLDASAAKWAQEKALTDAEAGVAYRRKLEEAAQKWNKEKAQKELQAQIEGIVFKKTETKKVNAEFMDKELHVHDSLWNEVEHSLESDPYFRF